MLFIQSKHAELIFQNIAAKQYHNISISTK